jgi:hypothetical protein
LGSGSANEPGLYVVISHLHIGSFRAFLAATALAAPVNAQRVMVPHNRPHAQIALVNIRVGALVQGDWIDVQATAIPPIGNGQLTDVELVGHEIWVAAPFRIYRYEARGDRNFIASFPVADPVRSIEAQSRAQGDRVIVTTTDSLRIFDREANAIGTIPIQGAGDTLELADSMLVAVQDESRIDRMTFDGQFIETFAGPTVPTTLGVLSSPKQLAQRINGNILVAGDVRAFEFSPTGAFIGEYDAGPFEGGIAESVNERLFITLQDGMALYDALTHRTTPLNGLYFGQGRRVGYYDEGTRATLQPGEWASDGVCRGIENSVGYRARMNLLGSPDLSEGLLSAFVDRMPPFAQARLMISTGHARTPAGSMGDLCLDADSRLFISGARLADSVGQASFELVRGEDALLEFGPGTTWFVQGLYRDSIDLRFSGAITFTLQL